MGSRSEAQSGESTPARPAREAPTVDPLLGTVVGNYRLVRALGRGGMGVVYLGEHINIGSRVAVKFLHEHLGKERTLVERFYAEARAANLACSEHVVTVFDLNVLPSDRYYLVMEYLEGRPFTALVANGAVAPEAAIPLLAQACKGLQAAHEAGVVHRDLKFENLFIARSSGREELVKILDFGIAKLLDTSPGITSVGLLVGTPEYMAPEQWIPGAVDGRADIYALAVITYALLTGRMPHAATDAAGYYTAHREKPVLSMRTYVPALSEELDRAVLRGLAKSREERYQSAREFGEALLDAGAIRPSDPRSRRALEAIRASLEANVPSTSGSRIVQSASGALSSAIERLSSPPLPTLPTAGRAAQLEATLEPTGGARRALPVAELTPGGVQFAAGEPFPSLRARARVHLRFGAVEFDCEAEVVRHVKEEQAHAWNMKPGFGVQFLWPSQQARDAYASLRAMIPSSELRPEPMGRQMTVAVEAKDDPEVVAELKALRERGGGADPYALLQLDPACGGLQIREAAEALCRKLEALQQRKLGTEQARELRQAIRRVVSAGRLLGSVPLRAAHDGERGNYRGVARCITEGLSTMELDALRQALAAKQPERSVRALEYSNAAGRLEAAGRIGRALIQLEGALRLDPLSLELHRWYWSLRSKERKKTTPDSMAG